MIYIRADGNQNIGMGHIMRCLSVAEALAEKGAEHAPIFILAGEECREMIESRGFQTIVLNTDYQDMCSELSALKLIFESKKDLVLVDSYQVSDEYFEGLKSFAKVACLEDVGISYPVDLLINYNIYGPKLAEKYINNKRTLLGAFYVPLRKLYQKPSDYKVKEQVSDVVITTGGGDPHFAVDAFLHAFLSNEEFQKNDIKWHVLSGPFNIFAKELIEKYGKCENVKIYENIKDMRDLLLKSDVVISATGSTIYEVSSLGVPMIVFYYADNQKQGAQALEKMTEIVNGGCFTEDKDKVVEKITAALVRCINDKNYRQNLFWQEKKLVDGQGAHRLAEELIMYAE